MKKPTSTKQKLKLDTQTIRPLTTNQLSSVAGGVLSPSTAPSPSTRPHG